MIHVNTVKRTLFPLLTYNGLLIKFKRDYALITVFYALSDWIKVIFPFLRAKRLVPHRDDQPQDSHQLAWDVQSLLADGRSRHPNLANAVGPETGYADSQQVLYLLASAIWPNKILLN